MEILIGLTEKKKGGLLGGCGDEEELRVQLRREDDGEYLHPDSLHRRHHHLPDLQGALNLSPSIYALSTTNTRSALSLLPTRQPGSW